MITVSTASPSEAQVARDALHDGIPQHMGYEVYLRGKLFASSQPVPPPVPDDWPSPPPEYR